MEQRLYDAAAKLPATNAKLDTSQMTGKIRATNSIGRVVITLAACVAAMCIILFGALSLASSVKEYNDAVAYFSMHNLSTDGLSRKDIKDVYKDIITGSFTHPKTADVLASKDNTEPQPTDPVPSDPTNPTTTDPTDPTDGLPVTDPTNPTDDPTLPEYTPGSIKLAAKDAYTTWAPKDRQYRASYYLIMGDFADVIRKSQPDAYNQWKSEINDAIMRGEWNDEMLLVSYIKHFNIPRASMEAALANYIYKRTPEQLKMEFYEAPNLDIIYTFDNEIINRYYRYELAAADPVPQSNLDPVTGLPIGVPEGFVFAPQYATEEAPADREYRLCYYNSDYIFMSLVVDRWDEVEALREERNEAIKKGTFEDEMWLVSLIKGLNISREDFDRAIKEYMLNYDPEDQMIEYYEMPNADILYTFDNEIINAYYHYEEPNWGANLPKLTDNTEHLGFYWTEEGGEYYYRDSHLRYIHINEMPFRHGYYNVWGEFLELANNRPGKSFDEWIKLRIAEGDSIQDCNEAALVSFLKYFEVPKEDFEAALEKFISHHSPCVLEQDYYWVLPDADIIYTFDNEVINQYYRKEDSNATNPSNPTVPNPTEPTDPSEPIEPTDPAETTKPDAVVRMQKLFDWRNGIGFYNAALKSDYATPADVNLYFLFSQGLPDETGTPTSEERELLRGKFESWRETRVNRIPAQKMDAVLMDLFGITLEQTNKVGLDHFVYLEETDCYYLAVRGSHDVDITVQKVEFLEDGTRLVRYDRHNYSDNMVLTLKPYGDGYQIISNQPEVEHMDTAEATAWRIVEEKVRLYKLYRFIGIACEYEAISYVDMSRFLTVEQKEEYFECQYRILCCHTAEEAKAHIDKCFGENVRGGYSADKLFTDDEGSLYVIVTPTDTLGYNYIKVLEYSDTQIVATTQVSDLSETFAVATFTLQKIDGEFVVVSVEHMYY